MTYQNEIALNKSILFCILEREREREREREIGESVCVRVCVRACMHQSIHIWGGSREKAHNVQNFNFCVFTVSYGEFNEETSVENRLK